MSVWGFPCLKTGVDLAIGLKHMSGIPLPWFRSRRCTRFNFTGPCPDAGLPRYRVAYQYTPSRGLGVGRSRSRADRLGDCPDETDELTSHRRNGDVLELAPPEQRSVTLIE